jgi:hypothetical protein
VLARLGEAGYSSGHSRVLRGAQRCYAVIGFRGGNLGNLIFPVVMIWRIVIVRYVISLNSAKLVPFRIRGLVI